MAICESEVVDSIANFRGKGKEGKWSCIAAGDASILL